MAVKHPPLWLSNILLYGCETWALLIDSEKRIQTFETNALGSISASPTRNTRPTTVCGARSTSLWDHWNLLWQLLRDGNLHGSSMSHTTTASPNPSFGAPWRVGDAVVDRGNAGWTISKSGHPCQCQSCSQGPPAKKDWKISAKSSLTFPWRPSRSRD